MKSIAYIIPYFGRLPELFPLWLNSCKYNSSVEWFLFTDDKRLYDYPANVHVRYMTFMEMKEVIQSRFNYDIWIELPYKLCDFKIAYGDIFHDIIKDYDFWGFCDIDLIWGNIRYFYNDEVLDKYDKIGFQGHSTLIRNKDYYNVLYKRGLNNGTSFREIAQSDNNCMSDEDYFNRIFYELNIPFYHEFTFANLSPFVGNFQLNYINSDQKSKNKYFVFEYDNGILNRVSTIGNKIYRDQYMYIHFLKRKMDVRIIENTNKYLIVPNKIIQYKNLEIKAIKKLNKPHYIKWFIIHFLENTNKINRRTIIPIIINQIRGYYQLFFKYDKVRL